MGLIANNATNTMELTAAGIGLGFTGAHLKSDGTNSRIFGEIADSSGTYGTVCLLNSSGGVGDFSDINNGSMILIRSCNQDDKVNLFLVFPLVTSNL
jgi:hypothetical protein